MGANVSKQSSEKSEQDLIVSHPATTSSSPSTTTTTPAAVAPTVTEELFFETVNTRLRNCNPELQTITLGDISNCFITPPSSEFEGHAVNKFNECIYDDFLQYFQVPNGHDVSGVTVSSLDLTTIRSRAEEKQVKVSVKLDPDFLLQVPVMPSFSTTFEIQVNKLSFHYCKRVNRFSFKCDTLFLNVLKVKCKLIVRAPGEETSEYNVQLGPNELHLMSFPTEICINDFIKKGTPITQAVIHTADFPELIAQKYGRLTIQVETDSLVERYTRSLMFSDDYSCWTMPESRYMFAAGSTPIIYATSNLGSVVPLKLTILLISRKSAEVSLKCLLQEGHGEGSPACEARITFSGTKVRIDISTNARGSVTSIQTLPTLRRARHQVKRLMFTKLGDLTIPLDEQMVSQLQMDSLPSFLLDECSATYRVSISQCYDSPSPPTVTVEYTTSYLPETMQTRYDFFEMIALLELKDSFLSTRYINLRIPAIMAHPISLSAIQSNEEQSYYYVAHGIALPECTLMSLVTKYKVFMTPQEPLAGDTVTELEARNVYALDVRLYLFQEKLEIRLHNISQEPAHVLLFDLKNATATLTIEKRPHPIQFSLKQRRRQDIYQKMMNAQLFADITIIC